MSSKQSQVAHFLDLCDRVEILSDIIKDESTHEVNEDCFQALMNEHYPCLEQFFRDMKGEQEHVVSIHASFSEASATFDVTYANQEVKPFIYHNQDPMNYS